MADTSDQTSGPPRDLTAARAALDETGRLLAAALDAHGRAAAALDAARTSPLNPPLNALFMPPEHTGEHRREHRSGRPRILDTDAELRAFVDARIDHMTFAEVAGAVAGHFPPDRRVGKSAIHDWGKRRR